MKKALLGGDERTGTVDVDRTTLEDHVDAANRLVAQFQPPACQSCIGVVRNELVAPPVEAPLGSRAHIVVDDVDGSGVTEPRVVDRQRNDVHRRAAQCHGVVNVGVVGDHRHRLESGNGAGHGGVGTLCFVEP
jgi:hypothetical protein